MTNSQDNVDREDVCAYTRFRNLNWEKARSFYIIAKSGSYSKAAHLFQADQSNLSRQILDLEKALGFTLFIREARGVRLTRKGEELYSIIEPTFLGLTGFTRRTYAGTNGDKERKIRICTTQAIANYILNRHIFAYNKKHPHLIFEIVTDDHMIDIVLNDVDIAIRPFDPNANGVQQEHLFTLEKRLYASSEYLEMYGEPQTVEDLKKHRIVAFARAEGLPYADVNWILRLGMSEGKLHKPIYSSNSIEAIVKAAMEGMGIIANYEEMEIIKSSNLKNILPQVKDKELKEYFIYPNYLENDLEIRNLKNFLKGKLFLNLNN